MGTPETQRARRSVQRPRRTDFDTNRPLVTMGSTCLALAEGLFFASGGVTKDAASMSDGLDRVRLDSGAIITVETSPRLQGFLRFAGHHCRSVGHVVTRSILIAPGRPSPRRASSNMFDEAISSDRRNANNDEAHR
jgi:hypothetical protein